MAGRPKKDIDLLVFENKTHLTQEQIEERKKTKIVAPADNIVPPKYLNKKLKERFEEIAKVLLDIGIMTNLDNDALARYVAVEEQYQKITKKLMKPKAMDDIDEYDKMTKIQDRLAKQSRASASDLGLTISSRGKLVLPKAKVEEPKTEGERRFAGRV